MEVQPVLHLVVAPSPIRLPPPVERAAANFLVAPGPLELLADKRDGLLPEPKFPGRGRLLDISV